MGGGIEQLVNFRQQQVVWQLRIELQGEWTALHQVRPVDLHATVP